MTYEAIVEWSVAGLYLYAVCGAAFALAFLTIGVSRVDSQARGSSLWFRLIIFFGAVALWPWLLRLWLRSASLPEEP